jgi:MFS family permease
VAGAAPSPTVLATARVLQGLAGGLIAPQTSGFIQNLFRGPDRARAFGLLGAVIGISTAVGPLLGGLLVNLGGPDLGWRLVFYVNVPIGLVLLPLVEGEQDEPLRDRPWWLLIPAVLLLAACLLWERSWARRGRETLIDLPLLRVRSFMFGLSLGTFYFAGFTAIFLVLTLYLQVGLGYSALEAGATQTPFAVGSAVASILGGRWLVRVGRGLAVIGLCLVITGLLAIDLLAPDLDGLVGLKLAPLLLLAGFGGGLVISPNVTLTLAEVDPRRAGSGGGMLQTAQRVGSAIGVAVVLAQFFAALADSRGDYGDALSVSLRTTIGLIAVALLFAVLDLVRRRTRSGSPSTYLDHAAPGKP